MAIDYLSITTDVVTVLDEQASADTTPLDIAAVLFARVAVGPTATRSRAVHAAGAALQLIVIAGYLLIAADRTPAFEGGASRSNPQAGLLAALMYLMAGRTPRTAARTGARTGATRTCS